MEIRVCPGCSKAFYAARDGESLICPHCGFVLYDRREKTRQFREVRFTFLINGEKIPATVKDYSKDGVKIVLKGSRALKVNELYSLHIDELNIHTTAKAVWTRKMPRSGFSAGLRLLH